MSIADSIRSMAARTCGVRADEIHGMTKAQANANIQQLVRSGQLFPLKISSNHTRYFRHPETREVYAREVYARENPPVVKTAKEGRGTEAQMAKRGRVDVGARAAWSKDAPAIVPEGVTVTVCPPWRPRFEEHEQVGVFGALQRGRVTRG